MSSLWQLLHSTTPPYQELLNAANASKGLYFGLAALVGLIMNSVAAPYEDDLHISVKALVVALLAAEGFVLPVWFHDQTGVIFALVLVASAALLLYAVVYWIWGVYKEVYLPGRLFRRACYKRILVLRGLRPRPDARNSMTTNHRELQDYFKDCGYRQNDVWSRGALAPVRLMALVFYVISVTALAGILLLIAKA